MMLPAKEMRLYINGELASAQSVTGTLSMSANPLTFSSSGTANVYHGRLDEARFYNRALTSGEVETCTDSLSRPRLLQRPPYAHLNAGRHRHAPADQPAAMGHRRE
jgi:hypothetical protein